MSRFVPINPLEASFRGFEPAERDEGLDPLAVVRGRTLPRRRSGVGLRSANVQKVFSPVHELFQVGFHRRVSKLLVRIR